MVYYLYLKIFDLIVLFLQWLQIVILQNYIIIMIILSPEIAGKEIEKVRKYKFDNKHNVSFNIN